MTADPGLVRRHHLAELQSMLTRCERELRVAGIDYCLLDTSKPLDHALLAYLHTRGRKQ